MNFVELKKSVPLFGALNVDEAQRFYKNLLGFSCRVANSLTLSAERGGVEIEIRRVHERNLAGSCRIQVDGIDDLYTEFLLKDVIEDSEFIRQLPDGTREFEVLDVYGNVLIFFQLQQSAAGTAGREQNKGRAKEKVIVIG